ncbi:MAG: DUF4190 domain-containing protein [Lachnospiraceae bacterium]|nr:DUF4190 domain-containing protein [Lachnospiraceae bacterium]
MDENKSYSLDKQTYNQSQAYSDSSTSFDQNQPYPGAGQRAPAGSGQPYPDAGQRAPLNQNQPYGQSPQSYPQQNYTQPARAVVYDTMPMKNNNVAIAGLVLGIFSILGCWIPFWNLVLSIAGIICSAIGLSHREQTNGMAVGGLITSIIGILLSLFMCFIYFIAMLV